MSDTWIEVQPGGYLKKFGNHRFLVSNPAQAIKAMMLQIPGFEKAFKGADKRGVKFAVKTDKRHVNDLSHLHMGKPKVVRIIPQYKGSKGAVGQIFTAIAIAALVVFAPQIGIPALAAGTTGGAIATSIAVSLALGGISQLLSPQPTGLSTREDVENQASYAFGGATNTTAQGTPLAAFYGDREVGGQVISVTILPEDQV
jgi:predicted phage tail protein